MSSPHIEHLFDLLKLVEGYIYPNDLEVHWSILVVVYPYLTGLVAGAFILASLVKVFSVKELQSVYRLSLLTALAFLLVAPLPLLLHLGHPERSFEIFLNPNFASAMAMFGFVYAWYLMVVLLLEIWFTYRKDLILWSRTESPPMKWVHAVIALFSRDVSDRSVEFDRKMVKAITIIGIPSAFLLHGYVGFIFGSVKANPWWSSVLMPIVFLFSAIVSGIALVIILYMIITPLRGEKIDMKALDTMASYLFYAVIIDFSLELLDFIHRLYQSEESIRILSEMVTNKLFISLVILQVSARHDYSPCHHGGHPLDAFQRGTAPAALLPLGHPDTAGHFRDAVECCDWRTDVLEEFPWPDDLQDGCSGMGRVANDLGASYVALAALGCSFEDLSCLGTPSQSGGRRGRIVTGSPAVLDTARS